MEQVSVDKVRELIRRSEISCREEGCQWKGHSIARHLAEAHPGTTLEAYQKAHKHARLATRLVTQYVRSVARRPVPADDGQEVLEAFDLPAGEDPQEVLNELASRDFVAPEGFEALVPEVDEHFLFSPDELRVLEAARRLGYNVYDSGPTGCGKTAKHLQFFARLGLPVRRVNMNGDVTYQNFIGTREAEGGRTFFRRGFLPEAMVGDGKRGFVVVLDEVDYTPPHIAALLNPVLEGGRSLYLPETGEYVEANPGFFVVATANTGGRGDRHGNYTGTEVLNSAFLDRFPVKLSSGYLPESLEAEMLCRRFPEEPEAGVRGMVGGAREVRAAFESGRINLTLSTRKLVDYYQLKRVLGAQAALALTILNWTDEDDGQLVRELLQRKGVLDEV